MEKNKLELLREQTQTAAMFGLGGMVAAQPGWTVLYRDGNGGGFSHPLQAWTADGRPVVMDPAVSRLVLARTMGDLVAVVEATTLEP